MLSMARAALPDEVGTSLAGHYAPDGYTAYVEELAPLAPDSRSSRRSFVRGVSGVKEYFSGLFQRWQGRRHYVGEWHSHPGADPTPSGTDEAAQAEIAHDMNTNCPEVVLVIVGGDVTALPHIHVSVYSRERGYVPLQPDEDGAP